MKKIYSIHNCMQKSLPWPVDISQNKTVTYNMSNTDFKIGQIGK